MIGPSTLIGLWTGRVGMTTLVVVTVLAGRRATSGLSFVPRLIVLVVLVLIVVVIAQYVMRQAQLRRAAAARDGR